MPFTSRLKVVLLLYRQVCPFSAGMSFLMWGLDGFRGWDDVKFPYFVVFFIWLRTAGQIGIWYLMRQKLRNQFVFYAHFGFSEIQLALICFLIDLILIGACIVIKSLLF